MRFPGEFGWARWERHRAERHPSLSNSGGVGGSSSDSNSLLHILALDDRTPASGEFWENLSLYHGFHGGGPPSSPRADHDTLLGSRSVPVPSSVDEPPQQSSRSYELITLFNDDDYVIEFTH